VHAIILEATNVRITAIDQAVEGRGVDGRTEGVGVEHGIAHLSLHVRQRQKWHVVTIS
jgi:hypothetical protein